jgi:hypothetical protein
MVAAWLALIVPLFVLGYATKFFGACPQGPDWWITTYSVTLYFAFWLVAPAFALFIGVLVFRRRWKRATGTI